MPIQTSITTVDVKIATVLTQIKHLKTIQSIIDEQVRQARLLPNITNLS